jgi:hypothetical protein
MAGVHRLDSGPSRLSPGYLTLAELAMGANLNSSDFAQAQQGVERHRAVQVLPTR